MLGGGCGCRRGRRGGEGVKFEEEELCFGEEGAGIGVVGGGAGGFQLGEDLLQLLVGHLGGLEWLARRLVRLFGLIDVAGEEGAEAHRPCVSGCAGSRVEVNCSSGDCVVQSSCVVVVALVVSVAADKFRVACHSRLREADELTLPVLCSRLAVVKLADTRQGLDAGCCVPRTCRLRKRQWTLSTSTCSFLSQRGTSNPNSFYLLKYPRVGRKVVPRYLPRYTRVGTLGKYLSR